MKPRMSCWTPAALAILSGSAQALASPFAASIDLSSVINGADGFVLNGINAYDFSGISVSGAGDVNGDGVDDLIIGARGADPGGVSSAGESYVVFGGPGVGAGGLGGPICAIGLELSCLDMDGTFMGLETRCETIACPGCAGDLDGDGDTDAFDFIIFAPDFGCGTEP